MGDPGLVVRRFGACRREFRLGEISARLGRYQRHFQRCGIVRIERKRGIHDRE